MGLSTVAIKAAKGRDKPFKLTDGDGLYLLEVSPSRVTEPIAEMISLLCLAGDHSRAMASLRGGVSALAEPARPQR